MREPKTICIKRRAKEVELYHDENVVCVVDFELKESYIQAKIKLTCVIWNFDLAQSHDLPRNLCFCSTYGYACLP